MASVNSNQLNTLLPNMFAAGLLNDHFRELQLLQDESAPDLVAEVLTLFCKDGERIIRELTKQLDQPCVEYDKVHTFVDQLWGCSANVGAQRVKNSCIQFHECCQEKNKIGCLKALDSLINDFYDLCSMFTPYA